MSDRIARLNAALEGRYSVKRELGAGGMAVVYLAEDLRHDREVAIKVLNPDLAAAVGDLRFLSEIKTTANLQHPHILPLFDSGEAGGFLYFVTPFIDGESLRDRLDREGQLPVDEAVQIATALADALHAAHELGVVHRDVKPANVLLRGGHPTLADFGISLVRSASRGPLTSTGLSVGTPDYMSPEQATGDQHIGPASDVFSLACLLYEMLVGEPPFAGHSTQAVLGKILQGPPASATALRRSIPPHVDAAMRRALERLPADRFRSAADFGRALNDPDFRYAGGAPGAVSKRRAGNRWVTAVLAGTTILLAGILALDGPAPTTSEPTRFSMSFTASDVPVSGTGVNLAISRDGSEIVYRGPTELWRRRLASLTKTPIPGTGGARNPVFSPDGSQIAFSAAGSLMVVRLEGGPPRVVVASGVPDAGGGIGWGWTDHLYFTDDRGEIRRVPTSGGEAEVLTQHASATRYAWLDILPEDRGVLFTITQGPPSLSQIAVYDTRSGEVRTLVGGAMARYAGSGQLVYAGADGGLRVAPFDLEDLEITGPTMALPETVEVYGGSASQFALSATGTLVYMPIVAYPELIPTRVSRDGTSRVLDPDWRLPGGRTQSSLALSPDGERLAISIPDADGTVDLWVKQLDDGPLGRLTSEGSMNYRPVWSSDGRRLLFVGDYGGANDLWERRADGVGGAALVLDAEMEIFEGLRTGEGQLVYRMGPSTTVGDVFIAGSGEGEPGRSILATEASERALALSPDGRWLAFVSDQSGREEVYVTPFPDSDAGLWLVSTTGATEPAWSPSGDELFYRSAADQMMVARLELEHGFRVAERAALFSTADYLDSNGYRQYDVTPDGQAFVMLRIQGGRLPARPIIVLNFLETLPVPGPPR